MKDMPLVSVIVPVYNVEKYLDQCLESVLKQTYQKIEILIMEGHSTDQSLEICNKWKALDYRIKVVSRKDGGLGPARNYGIKMANGEFIFFMDSDDYLPENAIENLIKIANEDTVDLVTGGYKSIDEQNVEKSCFFPIESGCDEIVKSTVSRKKYMRRNRVPVWGNLYRTSFLKKENIEMPSGGGEDLAIFPIVACKAKEIRCIDEIVYFYREGRNDSGSKNILKVTTVHKAVDYYCNYMKKINCFEKYRNELFFISRQHLTSWLDLFKKQLLLKEYKQIEKIYIGKLDEYFGERSIEKATTLFPVGSYNLRSECKAVQGFEVTKRHVLFTCMIAQFFDDKICIGEFRHQNQFRDKCLLNDKKKIVKKCLEEKAFTYSEIILDFMDDVKGIVRLSDGSVMSKTEAFDQAVITGVEIKENISFEDAVYWEMWKKACLNFIHCIKKFDCKIIMVKNRYTSKYKDKKGMHDFNEKEKIIKKNLFIEKMERYFIENYNRQNVYIVEVDDKKIYTDKYFKYGCSNEYLGKSGKIDVAEKIIKTLGDIYE